MSLFDKIVEKGDSYLIRGFPIEAFQRRLKREYKTTKLNYLLEAVGVRIGRGKNRTVKVHKFFLPEVIYLLEKFGYAPKLINAIIANTWMQEVYRTDHTNRFSQKLLSKRMKVKLRPAQNDFANKYDTMKKKYSLNGYLLSFDQGLGKTITSLATMAGIGKKKFIIIAPNSTLHTVWADHINQFFREKQSICIANEVPSIDIGADFIIMNYESLNKLEPLVDKLSEMADDVCIIVDESHNFLRIKSDRTQNLINIRRSIGCKDTLLLSGTPLKAVGVEMIPILMLLDPFFNDNALVIFKRSFGVNTSIANDVLNARLKKLMERKVKDANDGLPKKHELVLKVAIPNGDEYTVSKVQQGAKAFAEARLEYHNEHMHEYLAEFRECMEHLRGHTTIGKSDDFIKYLSEVEWMRKNTVDTRIPDVAARIQWANLYERKVLLPAMNKEIKRKFKKCKSAVKYVHLKVRGEVIGQYLMQMRMKMTSEMVAHADLEDIVKSAAKKTVVFTSYVDTVKAAGKYFEDKGMKPLVLHSNTKLDAKGAVKEFIKQDELNPLVSSINMLVTGVTIVVANTMIFLNKPFRFTDYLQASDRIHRIGQDTEVYIYTVLLDTGEKGNLSTRMEEIMVWSAKQFGELVGGNNEGIFDYE